MPRNSSILAVFTLVALAAVGGRARAEEPADPGSPGAPPPAPPRPVADLLDPATYAELTDEEILALAETAGEVIVVWDERPDKPFDRDTKLRLTEDDLRGRGVATLADALADLPDVVVRFLGRGGQQIDIRGARKAGVKILVDGTALDDPYYGTFDLTTIPITDIVEVRVSTSPASPIDGPGGPGGVIEVHTRDAIGARAIVAQVAGDTLPTAAAAATGRAPLTRALAVRTSATGTFGGAALDLPDGTIDEDRRLAGGALRLEWRPPRQTARRAVLDLAALTRAFLVPPSAEEQGEILRIHDERWLRGGAGYDDRIGRVRVQTRLAGYLQRRDAADYSDPALTMARAREDLAADRASAMALASRPVGADAHVVASAHLATESARAVDGHGAVTAGRSTIGEVAAGAQGTLGALRLDGAGGLAIPLGVGEAPWPEAKLAATVTPARALAITATVGRKGRLPTLRERYRLDVGNEALDPERASFAELRVTARPSSRVTVETASWARRQSGMILLDRMTLRLANVGTIDLRGIDARVDVDAGPVALLAAWSYTDADGDGYQEPLDFLPRHRVTGQVAVAAHARVDVRSRLRWASTQIDRNVRLPTRTDVEVDVVVRPVDGWLVSARLDDALDRRYPLRAGVPSAGRTLMLSVQAELR